METLGPPYLLIATPALRDPNFTETVVLMGQHEEQGALGWVINRLHDRPAREMLGGADRERVHPETPLHIGGPVPTETLLGLFHEAVGGVESTEVAPGLWLSGSADVLSPLFSGAPSSGLLRGRLVFGYAGWGPGQLEREMQEGAWLALPNDQELAFAPRVHDLWRRSFDRLGINPAMLTSPTGRKH